MVEVTTRGAVPVGSVDMNCLGIVNEPSYDSFPASPIKTIPFEMSYLYDSKNQPPVVGAEVGTMLKKFVALNPALLYDMYAPILVGVVVVTLVNTTRLLVVKIPSTVRSP